MVCNERLAAACLDSGLHLHLRIGSRALTEQVRMHVRRSGSPKEVSEAVPAAEVAPKILADVVESVIGAAYLDSGGDLRVVAQVWI